MKGRIFMNQKILTVELLEVDSDRDVLRFKFDDAVLDVNLNSATCQNDLKAVFVKLLQQLLDNEITLNLNYDETYRKGLYKEVCEEYIKDLNRELLSVKGKMQQELSA